MCHGTAGDGKGELASELPLKPRNFHAEPLQWGNSLASVITTATHGLSEVMPAFDGVLTPAQISEVANFVWSLIPQELKAREFKLTPHAAPASRVFLVHQQGKRFIPSKLTVRVGDMLVFVNDDVVVHEVHDVGKKRPASTIRSQKPLQWDRLVLAEPGSVRFGCALHASMRLDVTVEP